MTIMEIIGTIAFSVSGALIGVSCGLDIFGVVFLGVITSVGGGMLRDVIIGNIPPLIFSNTYIFILAAITAIIVFIVAYINRQHFQTLKEKIEKINNIFDAIGLSAFTVTGTEIACAAGFSDKILLVVLMGMTTGVGGGHMAVLMSGFCSEYFKAVGAYVPIMDLKKWSEQNPSYREHILACCENSDEEMMARSPVSYIDLIAKSNIKIFHGKFDKVVPVSQSIEFYNQIMKKHPTSRVFLDVFDGGHEIDMEIAMYWILSQYKEGNRIKVTG